MYSGSKRSDYGSHDVMYSLGGAPAGGEGYYVAFAEGGVGVGD